MRSAHVSFPPELTRQFSYAVHWSPSIHRSSHRIDFFIIVRAAAEKKTWRKKSERKRKTFVSFRRFVSIPFELTNWVNLSIIFDLFGVLCIQTIGDYHKLCSRVRKGRRRRGEEKENFFPCIHTLRIHFSDQTNTRGRKSSQRIHKKKKRPDKRCIKWIYFSM